MKRILVLGAGQSAPHLIDTLLQSADAGREVVVADRDLGLAEARVAGHPRGRAIEVDAADAAGLRARIGEADVVVNFLAPSFQVPIARLCLDAGRSMVSASYRAPELLALEGEAKARGLVFASELGLDPGLDHMSAMRLLRAVGADGGRVRSFASYGSGVVDRATVPNPLGYAITWNPRNVVMAGEAGARFIEGGRVRLVPYPEVFRRTWRVEVPGEGAMEAYANRDSVGYVDLYGVSEARTVVRATLRHEGYCETWSAIARLGLANERVEIPGLEDLSWRELLDVFLPGEGEDVEGRLALHLGLHPSSRAMSNLRWLGLLSSDRVGERAPGATTPAAAMIGLLRHRLALPEGGRDLVILHHEVLAEHDGELRRHTSTLAARGEPGGVTAMARAVGLPAALATLEILEGRFPLTGCPIPTADAVWTALLPRIEASGLRFAERSAPAHR